MAIFTKRAVDVFNPVDASSNPRGASMGETQTWGIEVEQALVELGLILGAARIVTAAGDVTVTASEGRVHVKKTIEEATNVNFPSVAARIAAGGAPFSLKNRMSNPALYPLTLVLSGTDTLEDSAVTLPMDTREETTFWPDDSVTPNNWEIR